MYTQLGGFDGLDYNTFEAYVRAQYASNPTLHEANVVEIVWQAQQFKALFGNEFFITMPPSSDGFHGGFGGATARAPLDGKIAKALADNNLLGMVAPQFYEFTDVKIANNIKLQMDEWFTQIAAPARVGVGLSMHRTVDSPTLAECQRELAAILTAQPNMRGVFGWNARSNIAQGNVWGAAIRAQLGLPLVTPNSAGGTAPGESSLTAAMNYNGGQNGGWYDINTAYLETSGPGTVTASGNPVWKILDRSINTNHLVAAASTVGTYTVAGASKYVYMDNLFASSTGGGSGDVLATGGFFLSYVVDIRSDYCWVYSDQTTANVGRYVFYQGYLGQIEFSVGTGAERRYVYSQTLAALNVAPNIPMHIICWQDATHIHIQVNGGPINSNTCAAVSPGNANNHRNGASIATPGFSASRFYYGFHTLSSLTPALRDGVNAFVATKKPA